MSKRNRRRVKQAYRAARDASYEAVYIAMRLGVSYAAAYPLFKTELARRGFTSSIRPRQFQTGFDVWSYNQSGEDK